MKVCRGAIFAVPLGNGEYTYGQIVADTSPKCYVVFDLKAKEHPSVDDIVRCKIIMLTYTVDVFIEDGDWILIGYAEPNSGIIFPNYLIETPSGTRVMDYTGKIFRDATDDDIKILGTQKSVSPKVLDLAIKAKMGNGEWYPTMQILLYKE